jgi:paraquat-inducible protein A
MAPTDRLIICEHCDAVYEPVELGPHQRALCVQCHAVIQRYDGLTIEQRLALTITAAVLWAFANVYPVMSIRLQGLSNSATLWDSVVALSQGPITFIALVAAVAIIIAPAVQLALLLWVLSYAYSNRRAPAFNLCMRSLETCWVRWSRSSSSPGCSTCCRASACSPWGP